MTAQEKENFCQRMAALFSLPEREIVDQVLRGGGAMLAGFQTACDPEAFFLDLKKEYDRLFAGPGGKSSLLVESSYKSWTQDPSCHLPFARKTGLLLGDSALHMAALFKHWGVEVPESFRACPDHLVLELEFLSALYGGATDREIRQFISDHLDWIPQLKKELNRLHAHPYYGCAIEELDSFLNQEKDRLETEENGKKILP